MGINRKLKKSYFYMFFVPAVIIVLFAAILLFAISERYEQQLANISDEAILTAAVQSVIKDFKEFDNNRLFETEERSYKTMVKYLEKNGYGLSITANGKQKHNTLTEEDIKILETYDDSLYESEDFMTLDNGTASVIKQTFIKDDTEYVLVAVNSDYTPAAMVLIENLKIGILIFALVIICVMIFLIYVTNRILSEKTSKMILTPLELLSFSARTIKDGNLDSKVSYDSDDEFSDVCSDFDDMRLRLKKSVEEEIAFEENRRELFAGISHDLRSPLTSVKGYSKGLLDGVATTDEKRREYYTTIYQKACEVDALVDKLFLFSKLDTNKYPFHFTSVRLSSYLGSFSEMFESEYRKNGLDLLIFNSCPEDISLDIDIEEMNRVLLNILDNSLKYKVNQRVSCSIKCRVAKNYVQIDVSDNGAGVPEDTLSHLFEAFYRTEKSRKDTHKGSGLGLAISKNIIMAHGGTICAQNDNGLVIKIRLPLKEEVK